MNLAIDKIMFYTEILAQKVELWRITIFTNNICYKSWLQVIMAFFTCEKMPQNHSDKTTFLIKSVGNIILSPFFYMQGGRRLILDAEAQ